MGMAIPPQPGTIRHMKDAHAAVQFKSIPSGIILGPFLTIGPVYSPRCFKICTWFAFWLLKMVGWEFITSRESEIPI